LTVDNGTEFAQHEKVAKALKADLYFAHPYCAWERGLNENTNGLLRQYFPKGTNFKIISDAKIRQVEKRLNQRKETEHLFFKLSDFRDTLLEWLSKDKSIRLEKLEKECEGKRMDQIRIRTGHLENLSPIDDIRAKADFRLDVVSELILRAVRQTS